MWGIEINLHPERRWNTNFGQWCTKKFKISCLFAVAARNRLDLMRPRIRRVCGGENNSSSEISETKCCKDWSSQVRVILSEMVIKRSSTPHVSIARIWNIFELEKPLDSICDCGSGSGGCFIHSCGHENRGENCLVEISFKIQDSLSKRSLWK